MSFYKFNKEDLLRNTLVAHPEFNFFIYEQQRYINNREALSGTYSDSITGVPSGFTSLYEYDVNQSAGNNSVYPFVEKEKSSYFRLSPLDSGSQRNLEDGVVVTGSYPLSASIQYLYFSGSSAGKLKLNSLKNTMNYYTVYSPHYAFSSSFSGRDLESTNCSLVSIPSIMYGESIKKGSVDLRFYLSGSLLGSLQDTRQNGELIQYSGTLPTNDGKIGGVVLYNEGIILLTGSWSLSASHTEDYGSGNAQPSWLYFGSSISSSVSTPFSSYTLSFKGTERIPSMTAMAKANRGQLNYSTNPSFIKQSGQITTPLTGTHSYVESKNNKIVNLVSSSYPNHSGSFEKITYISKINIYDEDRNVIAVAKLATPVRKREKDHYLFKLKVDM